MSRIEMPTSVAEVQDLADRYGAAATIIGLNEVRTDRLNGFINTYIDADAEPIAVTINGKTEWYSHKRIAAVTALGDMVHARLHESPHKVDDEMKCLAVIDTVFSDEPTEYWMARYDDYREGFKQMSQTEVTASRIVGYAPHLRLVELEDGVEPDDPVALGIEQVLAKLSLPQLSFGDRGWSYRTGPQSYDVMYEIHDVQSNVVALRREREIGAHAARSAVALPYDVLQPTGSDQ